MDPQPRSTFYPCHLHTVNLGVGLNLACVVRNGSYHRCRRIDGCQWNPAVDLASDADAWAIDPHDHYPNCTTA